MEKKALFLISSFLVFGCTSSLSHSEVVYEATGLKHRDKPIVVAVIDTGIDTELLKTPYMCKFGHKDFTGKGLTDHHGHGTHISGIIQQYVTNMPLNKNPDNAFKVNHTHASYCQVVLKYFDPTQSPTIADPMRQEIEAIKYAINIKVDLINISGGGTKEDDEEVAAIKKALDMGIKVVVAAGNEKADIVKHLYYPASIDPRIIVVGNINQYGDRLPSSNYGDTVKYWEVGENVLSTLPNNSLGYMTGTSQSTAIKTGKLIHEMLSH